MIQFRDGDMVVRMNERGEETGRELFVPTLAVVMPYYRNPRMLRRQLIVWRDEWSADLKQDVEVVLVDDGSPDDNAADAISSMWQGDRTGLPMMSVYRVMEDRPWHQHGARNLGAHVTKAKWLLMTDMDHVVPHSTLAETMCMIPSCGKNDVLTFGRVDAPATLTWKADHWPEFDRTRREDGTLKPHVNSFVVTRERYWKLGGYDEDFCGVYGTDKLWRDKLFGGGAVERHLDYAPLIRVGREVIDDASTRGVKRKIEGRNAFKKAVTVRKIVEGRAGKPLTLNFPWERVL